MTKYLSKELQTKIQIEKVQINFLSGFTLDGVYLEDQHEDTLLFAKSIGFTVRDISTSERKLLVKRISLSQASFHLNQYAGEEHDNLYFLLDYFTGSDSTVDSTSKAWDVRFEKIDLDNVAFKHWVEGDTLSPVGINFTDISIDKIYGSFEKLRFEGDSLFVDINRLSFREKSGFKVNEFRARAKIASNEMRFTDLHIKSPQTEINGNLTFEYDSFADFTWFTRLIQWKADFVNTNVSFEDIAYFAPDLWGIKNVLALSGNFKGSVHKFKGKNVDLRWGEKSYFKGNVGMYGLPNFAETFMDVQADELSTTKKDVEVFPLYPFTEGKTLKLPDNMATLGEVKFKGKFTGFYSDFVAYGNISTALGYISSDLNLKHDAKTSNYFYQGHLSATNFNVGKLISKNDLGLVSFNAQVKGSGLRIDNIDARMTGTVQALGFKNYTYRNIKVDGELSKKLFNGALTIHERNLDLDFQGAIDFRDSLPLFNFTAMIDNANLDSLHLIELPNENILKTSVTSSLRGNRLDNLEGSVEISNTFLRNGKRMYRINNVLLTARKESTSLKSLKLNSDFMDASINGQFELASLMDAFKEILPRYLPSVVLPLKKNPGNQNFSFDIHLRNTNLITEIFLPSWTIDPMTFLTGKVNTVDQSFNMFLQSPSIRYNSLVFHSVDLKVNANNSEMSMLAHLSQFNFSEKSYIPNVELISSAKGNVIKADLHLADADSFPNRAHLKAGVEFFSATRFDLKFDTSSIVLKNKLWNINSSNIVAFDSSSIRFSSLSFSSENESVDVDGIIGTSIEENLRLKFSNFNLNNLDPLLQLGNSRVGGRINGDLILNEARTNLKAETDLMISNLVLNDDTLGNAKIVSRFNGEQKIVVANIEITKGTAKIIDIKGNYYAAKEEDNLDFDIHISNLYLRTIERYIDEILSEVRGKVSADLKLTGTMKEPVFEGSVDFARATCIVNYLNTKYSFTNTVKVSKNVFDLSGVTIIDKDNNEAKVKGKITHNFFDQFAFDVEVYPKNFQMLNTSYAQNSLYYGNAVVSGYAHFYGPLNQIAMDINLSPGKGTLINIPLSNSAEVTQSDFITFVDHTKNYEYDEKPRSLVTNSGISLNMNLDMNPSATINLIFDEKIGDVISGTGDGSIRLDINTNGEFSMYGTYTISRGEYLFTLQNLINKKFIVDSGSKITWAGDPYEANVDLSAVYVLYTSSLYNLVQDSTYKRRLPVECRLLLTNKLLNPTINYEISVRGLDPTGESIVKSILNSEQEVSKQMFSLLLLNQFSPPSSQTASSSRIDAGAGAGASASELLSNQVSNWLGRLSKDVNIGINYRSRDNYSNEEIQLLFAKSLFNDRLLVEGNVGYTSNQTQNTNDLVGDFYAEYKVSEDGRFRLKGFNRSNADNILNYSAPYTQGFGIFFRQEFNDIPDLLRRLKLLDREKNKNLQ
ncbi:MAG: translocation/assembly module TamB [Bacteroidetes bacterium]|nr:MAG: translocation/assembly module TamB [Bacteroidota bacterium]